MFGISGHHKLGSQIGRYVVRRVGVIAKEDGLLMVAADFCTIVLLDNNSSERPFDTRKSGDLTSHGETNHGVAEKLVRMMGR